MKKTLLAASTAFLMVVFVSCEKVSDGTNEPLSDNKWEDAGGSDEYTVSCTGVLTEQGITSYMYGTHNIGCCGHFYALRSSSISLQDYVGQTVTVTGDLVSGYPVDGGPDFLDVTGIQN